MFLPSRLDKFLGDQTELKREQIHEAVAEGRVLLRFSGEERYVNIQSAHPRIVQEQRPRTLIFGEDALILIDDFGCHSAKDEVLQGIESVQHLEELEIRARYLDGKSEAKRQVHLLFKPADVTTSCLDQHGQSDLQPWISRLDPGMVPVGRLDRETTGAILLTDDGDLTFALLHPSHHAPKRYWLWLDLHEDEEVARIEKLADGVQLEEGFAEAKSFRILERDEFGVRLELVLEQGMRRQIRRMCKRLDLRLIHLHRAAIGELELGDLSSGMMRELSTDEIAGLWKAVGGRESVKSRRRRALLCGIEKQTDKTQELLRQYFAENLE